jgi:AraC-like DNA-binding protein
MDLVGGFLHFLITGRGGSDEEEVDMAELTFLHGAHTPGCTAYVDKHFVGYFTIQYMTAGKLELFYDDEFVELTGPVFWPAYPGPHVRFHRAQGVASWDHRYVAFQGPMAGRWAAQGLYPRRAQRAPRGAEHVREFELLYSLMFKADAISQRRAVNVLEGMLLELAEARQVKSEKQGESWLLDVLDKVPVSQSPDEAAYAKEAGMAVSTLRRRFKEAVGVPISAYVLQRRIIEARRLLGETDEPIKVIAERLGYRDVYFFTRQFKKKVGVPPSAYRKSRLG